MVLGHALLPVTPGREAAFARAVPLISGTPGFRRLRLSRSVQHPGSYLLLVEWDRPEDHTEGFRGSDRYAAWSALLHPFYDPFPEVGHADPVLTVEAPWAEGAPGVVRLPSGALVRGRGLRRPSPEGPLPTFAVHLVGRRPPAVLDGVPAGEAVAWVREHYDRRAVETRAQARFVAASR